eukprot:229178-Alexandrium_andersonii.AAC.1
MSASLVGSEMCIRDRVLGCVHPPHTDPSARGAPSAQTPRKIRIDKRAVSYTHLTLPTICSV